MRGAPVHHEPAPVVVNQQEARVRLVVVLDAELDEHLVLDRHALDEELDDPVVAELREDLELRTRDLVRPERRHRAALEAAELDAQPVELHLHPGGLGAGRAQRSVGSLQRRDPAHLTAPLVSLPGPPDGLEAVEEVEHPADVALGGQPRGPLAPALGRPAAT